MVCDDLPKELCAFSIASSGKRCLLETYVEGEGNMEYQCRTSEVVVVGMAGCMETDDCVAACGVDRNSVGISSDSLLEPQFTAKLCSPACYQNCPNIIDLYFNLAAGEGAFLPALCEAHRSNPRRSMLIMSSRASNVQELSEAVMAPASAPAPQ
ncbi:hypothetical protein SLEP1_g21510 [Rubroshorea leprosula]|uniref:PAR1 protein n=1 Tax=Rubroshorea leprosula TaxID=152421 RepID=A0AAV5J673_9ROSI|nr:hypothetical protein SLEP1_g21510 [Rubroshorea leprosula]